MATDDEAAWAPISPTWLQVWSILVFRADGLRKRGLILQRSSLHELAIRGMFLQFAFQVTEGLVFSHRSCFFLVALGFRSKSV